MDAQILCTLIAKQVPPAKFQIWGTEVKWLVAPSQADTNAVNSIIANYDSLAAALLQEEFLVKQAEELKVATKNQAILDLLPSWDAVKTAFDNLDTEINNVANVPTAKAAMAKMATIMRKHLRIYYIDIKDSLT
jgi:hypothetical protein